MDTVKLQGMKERLADVAGEWLSEVKEEHPSLISRRRQQAAELERLRDLQEKESLKIRQYEETQRAFIKSLIGDAGAGVEEKIAQAEAGLSALYEQYRGVCERLGKIQTTDVVDLSAADVGSLVETAMKRRKSSSDEAAALGAAKLELERRIGIAEAGAGELRAELHRAQRIAVHQHMDALIEEMGPLFFDVVSSFEELGRCQEIVRGLGGHRQYFFTQGFVERLKFARDRWDRELTEVKELSEQY